MKTAIATLSKQGKGESIPRICLAGNWLSDVGFDPDSLVQAIPEKDGILFTAYDENIRSYRELVQETKRQNGKLFPVMFAIQGKHKCPTIATVGSYLVSNGLVVGDVLILRYGSGKIQARKCDITSWVGDSSESSQILLVRDGKRKKNAPPLPHIRIGRAWLSEIGFQKDALVSVHSEWETITLTLESQGISEYREVVKRVRTNRMRLIQITDVKNNGKYAPVLTLSGTTLTRSGFEIGDVVVATYTEGQIRFHKIPSEQLGFTLFP